MLIDRELKKINAAIVGASPTDALLLHAAQQALAWAGDPLNYRSPYETIVGTQAGSKDCSDAAHPLPSSNTCVHCAPR